MDSWSVRTVHVGIDFTGSMGCVVDGCEVEARRAHVDDGREGWTERGLFVVARIEERDRHQETIQTTPARPGLRNAYPPILSPYFHLRPWGDGVILFGWRVDAGANYGAYEEEERQ